MSNNTKTIQDAAIEYADNKYTPKAKEYAINSSIRGIYDNCITDFIAGYNVANAKLEEQAKEIERLKGEKWIDVSVEPKFGGEYNVVYDLEDGGELVVSTMDYDKTTKLWMDTRGANIPIFTVKKWQELPPIN